MDSTQRHLVRTNQVAPIIIKNCKEEYQHVTDFKEPLVYGRIAENMPEHALIKVSCDFYLPLIFCALLEKNEALCPSLRFLSQQDIAKKGTSEDCQ